MVRKYKIDVLELLKWTVELISFYLLLNRTRNTARKINKLRSQLARANVRINVVQLVAR